MRISAFWSVMARNIHGEGWPAVAENMRGMPARRFAVAAGALALLAVPGVAAGANEDISFSAAGVMRHAIISPPELVKPGVRPPVVLVFPREGTTA